MYRIYSTEGIVLKSRGTGETSKILALFTKELGLVYARAQGIRAERSKLRYHLQDFSFARFEMVQGKNGWRITNAVAEENLAAIPGGVRKEPLGVLSRVTALLLRLLRGEEKDEILFNGVLSSFRALKNGASSLVAIRDFEALLVMRVLHRLGYWGNDEVLSPFLILPETENAKPPASFSSVRARAVRRINEALRETQL